MTITIPIYKAELSINEQESLIQLFSILGNYPICLFTYKELNLNNYQNLLDGKNYTITYFDYKYFNGINGYNSLMCSTVFYERFSHYKYLLIYQLDAWVFSDHLKFWCHQDYDYIGAPWFTDYKNATPDSPFSGVGNGGFSLRKTRSHLKVLNSFSYIRPFSEIWQEFSEEPKTYRNFKRLLRNLTTKNNTFYKFNDYNKNEDAFWGIIVNKNFKWFTIPDMIVAAEFSFEVNASKLYTLTGYKLPFGCHALLRFDPDFFYTIRKLSATDGIT